MSHHRLRGVSKQKSLVYVGGALATYTGVGNITLSLTSLTGGIASSPAAGDVVIVAYGASYVSDANLSLVTSGYTELADLFGNDTNDTVLGVYAKDMGSTPDTSVRATNTEDFAYWVLVAQVWRNTNVTSGVVTPIETATGANTGRANPPSVTPTVPGSVVIVAGIGSVDSMASAFTAPSGITLWQSNADADPCFAMGAYVGWTSGAYNCAAFGGGSTSSYDSWCAASIILKPV